MVDFMTETSRQKTVAFSLKRLPVNIQASNRNLPGTENRVAELGNAEATLIVLLFAFGSNDFRVANHHQLAGIITHRKVYCRKTDIDSDLSGSQANPCTWLTCSNCELR